MLDSGKKCKEQEDWKNKKVNLNFFENKNLIKELRAKYLPEIEIKNKSESLLNLNLNNINNKEDLKASYLEKREFILNNSSKDNYSFILIEGNTNEKYNLENKESKNYKKDIIKEKNVENKLTNKNKIKTTKFKTQRKVVIENRFYTEIIKSNILLDKNLLLNVDDEIAISSKYKNKDKNKFNNIFNNYKPIINNSLKNKNDILMRNEKNKYINIPINKKELYPINQNNEESSTNKEMISLNNKEIYENINNKNINKEQIHNIFDIKNNNGNNEILKLENQKMKKEIKNYEKLIEPLINYINDINRILNQREINLDDITEIINNEYPSKSSFYINTLIRHLNNSKDKIAFNLDEIRKKYNKRKKVKNKRIFDLKQCIWKGGSIKRSADNSKSISFFDININSTRLYRNGKVNYYYDDISDKYIFDYYKDRNINCFACLLGNNNSQRGYSPNLLSSRGSKKG